MYGKHRPVDSPRFHRHRWVHHSLRLLKRTLDNSRVMYIGSLKWYWCLQEVLKLLTMKADVRGVPVDGKWHKSLSHFYAETAKAPQGGHNCNVNTMDVFTTIAAPEGSVEGHLLNQKLAVVCDCVHWSLQDFYGSHLARQDPADEEEDGGEESGSGRSDTQYNTVRFDPSRATDRTLAGFDVLTVRAAA